MKAQAKQIGGFKLAVDDARTGMAGEVILMIKGRGAAVFDQLCHSHDRRMVKALLGQAGKNWIDAVKPLQHGQLGPIQIGAVAHEGLEEMMMRIDQAGVNKPAAGVDHLGASGQRACRQVRPNGSNGTAVDQNILVTQHRQMG